MIKKFEYFSVSYFNILDQHLMPQLNILGDEGWELTSVTKNDRGTYTYIFKREKQDV
jgi:hypothetical protein